MSTESGSRAVLTRPVVLAGVAAGVLITAWFDERWLAGYLTVVSSTSAAAVVRWWIRPGGGGQIAAGLGAAAFAPAALQFGEPGLLWAATGAVLLIAGQVVLEGRVARALELSAVELVVVVASGSIGAYLLLIRAAAGRTGVVAILAMLASYAALVRLAAPRMREPGPAGAVACAPIGAAVLRLGGTPIGLISGLVLGITVGLAALLGTKLAETVTGRPPADDPRRRGAQEVLQPVLGAVVAMPAFFYGLTLYLW